MDGLRLLLLYLVEVIMMGDVDDLPGDDFGFLLYNLWFDLIDHLVQIIRMILTLNSADLGIRLSYVIINCCIS